MCDSSSYSSSFCSLASRRPAVATQLFFGKVLILRVQIGTEERKRSGFATIYRCLPALMPVL